MLNFKKTEIFVIIATLIGIISATALNLKVSYMRSRDVTRKNDMRALYDGLIAYRNDYASFPASEQGKIVACFNGLNDDGTAQRRICEWVTDPLPDIFEMSENENYIDNLPSDPKHVEGRRYLYLSNGRYFQVFAALEGKKDEEYREDIVERNLMCGNEVCNFGRSSDEAPLEKSIEEYENELRQKETK